MPAEKTKVIIKTRDMELARLVIPAGHEFKEHTVAGPITVHGIKGKKGSGEPPEREGLVGFC